jgi:hypothetical protein
MEWGARLSPGFALMLVLEQDDPELYTKIQEKNLIRQYDLVRSNWTFAAGENNSTRNAFGIIAHRTTPPFGRLTKPGRRAITTSAIWRATLLISWRISFVMPLRESEKLPWRTPYVATLGMSFRASNAAEAACERTGRSAA